MSSSPKLKEEPFILIPIFASSIINISKSCTFNQILTYDYFDEFGEYYKKIQSDYEFYLKEVKTIFNNMQSYMDRCINQINNKRVNPKVIQAEIAFKNERFPFYYWVISFKGELKEKQGLNVYKSVIDEEELEYNILSIYILEKPFTPISVESNLHYEILKEKNIVKYYGNKGEIVGPIEILRFKEK
ncbi:MAG: hypothetical protein ACTSWY_14795 [Promethearchaeota archaeon]